MTVYDDVYDSHRPSDSSSWAYCTACRQFTPPNGFGESFPVWPCDAIRVVMSATGLPAPSPVELLVKVVKKRSRFERSDTQWFASLPERIINGEMPVPPASQANPDLISHVEI